MGSPRKSTVLPGAPGFFHCVSRCVRRAWLCGEDSATGANFDHRREWIERRMVYLAESFAVGLYAWAVMSNHSHVILFVDPSVVASWSDEEVARRWARLGREHAPIPAKVVEERAARELRREGRVSELRRRLGDLSWFMRFLNESVARAANAEDECTGRFWEGRFRCQALLDENALLLAMSYVELNPIRAGLADDLAASDFTTIQRRLRALEKDEGLARKALGPMAGICADSVPSVTLEGYVALVETRRLQTLESRGGHFADPGPRPARRIRGSPPSQCVCPGSLEAIFPTAVGTRESLAAHAAATGRKWLWGMTANL